MVLLKMFRGKIYQGFVGLEIGRQEGN